MSIPFPISSPYLTSMVPNVGVVGGHCCLTKIVAGSLSWHTPTPRNEAPSLDHISRRHRTPTPSPSPSPSPGNYFNPFPFLLLSSPPAAKRYPYPNNNLRDTIYETKPNRKLQPNDPTLIPSQILQNRTPPLRKWPPISLHTCAQLMNLPTYSPVYCVLVPLHSLSTQSTSQ